MCLVRSVVFITQVALSEDRKRFTRVIRRTFGAHSNVVNSLSQTAGGQLVSGCWCASSFDVLFVDRFVVLRRSCCSLL